MGSLIAFALLAAAPSGAQAAPAHAATRVTASARASVVILAGARVNLSGDPQPDGQRSSDALVTTEDGSRRPAKLVEFQ